MRRKWNRRDFFSLAAAGTVVSVTSAGRLRAGLQDPQEGVVEIRIDVNYKIGRWFFDPVGVYLQPGQKVRWVCRKWGGSATAFHPSNENHELRIPEAAEPFDSGILIQGDSPQARFETTFSVQGTYDYYSRNHERQGAVGRIIVGRPGGPGERPPGYGGKEGRAVFFSDAKKLLEWLTSDKIMQEKVVRYPMDLLARSYPLESWQEE